MREKRRDGWSEEILQGYEKHHAELHDNFHKYVSQADAVTGRLGIANYDMMAFSAHLDNNHAETIGFRTRAAENAADESEASHHKEVIRMLDQRHRNAMVAYVEKASKLAGFSLPLKHFLSKAFNTPHSKNFLPHAIAALKEIGKGYRENAKKIGFRTPIAIVGRQMPKEGTISGDVYALGGGRKPKRLITKVQIPETNAPEMLKTIFVSAKKSLRLSDEELGALVDKQIALSHVHTLLTARAHRLPRESRERWDDENLKPGMMQFGINNQLETELKMREQLGPKTDVSTEAQRKLLREFLREMGLIR